MSLSRLHVALVFVDTSSQMVANEFKWRPDNTRITRISGRPRPYAMFHSTYICLSNDIPVQYSIFRFARARHLHEYAWPLSLFKVWANVTAHYDQARSLHCPSALHHHRWRSILQTIAHTLFVTLLLAVYNQTTALTIRTLHYIRHGWRRLISLPQSRRWSCCPSKILSTFINET